MDNKEDVDLRQLCDEIGLDPKVTRHMGVKTLSGLGRIVRVLDYDLTKVETHFGVTTMVAAELITLFKPPKKVTGNADALRCGLCNSLFSSAQERTEHFQSKACPLARGEPVLKKRRENQHPVVIAAKQRYPRGYRKDDVHVLGVGGNGCVVLAQCRGGAPVALKLFRHPQVFHKERRILQLLQGCDVFPRVVCGTDEDQEGICMKLYEAISADNLVVSRAVSDVSLALRHLHDSLGMCHNDVKPDNVMFDADSGRYILIDFSNAKRLGEVVPFGTHAYVHPDYRAKSRPVAPVVDNYAFLCLIEYWGQLADCEC